MKNPFEEDARMAIQTAYLLGVQHATRGETVVGLGHIVPAVAAKLREIKIAVTKKDQK